MGERRVDEDGYVWEKSSWSGNWEPVRDSWGRQVRQRDSTWWGAGRSEDERREEVEKKGGCYITTACVRARGLPDDCEELEAFRAFRDGYVVLQLDGEQVLRDYYATAPAVVDAIDRAPGRKEVYEEIYAWVRATIDMLDKNETGAAYRSSVEFFDELKRRFL
jgi:hypothetical protein